MSLIPQYPATQNTETKKIFCAYHRTQFLTNFCLEKQCLMPLCPSCVAEHTQQHYQSSQKPTYINLNQGLYDVKHKCYSYIGNLEQYSKKNDELIRYFDTLSKNIHEQLTHAKQQIYIKIQHMFSKYQSKVLREVEDYYHNSCVYDNEEGETIREFISQRIQILYQKIGLLKGDQCLAALIKFYDTQQQDYQSELKQVSSYLEKHRKIGQAEININFQLMNQKLEDICEQFLTLSFIGQLDKDTQKYNNIRNSKIKKGVMTPSKQDMKNTSMVRNSGVNTNKGVQSRFARPQ